MVRWIEAGILAAIVCLLETTNVALKARVYLSEDQLLDHVHFAQHSRDHGKHIPVCPVGLFTIHDTYTKGSTVWMTTVLCGPPFSAGLVYCQEGPPTQRAESEYEHLYGPWWRWLQDI